MTPGQYDREADVISKQLPVGPRVAVVGSTTFWGHDTEEICVTVGTQLAGLEGMVLITGGMPGVAEAVGRSFLAERHNKTAHIYHILPRGSDAWDYGITLHGGDNMEDRREILGRLSSVYLSIEGGPGTAHEAQVARNYRATIVPIGRTGGFSLEIYPEISCPQPQVESEWQLLNDPTASLERLSHAVKHIVDVLNRHSDKRTGVGAPKSQ